MTIQAKVARSDFIASMLRWRSPRRLRWIGDFVINVASTKLTQIQKPTGVNMNIPKGSQSDTVERLILLEALVKVWEQEANEDVLADRLELERCIAWQVLAISGAYDRHAQHMKEIRDAKD
jgi:hypothetical protein